ncbi:RNB domain-containing ribonuclease, partial [Oscillospiraceae bacterium OttesenSCG-928-F05]|nr:RNB domain-containing ribonuclease [Oscillospiraceae bacterium OttesenSCG-928-F05]
MDKTLMEAIEARLGTESGQTTEDALFKAVGAEDRAAFAEAVAALEGDGRIIRTKRGKIGRPEAFDLYAGRFSATKGAYGFVVPDNPEKKDFFIPPRKTGGAWNGDRVLCKITDAGGEGRGESASVERVIRRANTRIPGVVIREGHKILLVPDDKRLPGKIEIQQKGAKQSVGKRVAVQVTGFNPPIGRLDRTFGESGARDAIASAILYMYGIEPEFPQAALDEARTAAAASVEGEIAGRRDLRDKVIFTIDGAHAKDLDDAISLERDAEGRRVVGVHIADVSHYVRWGSALDDTALSRGTSVYYADKVIPMLPGELSNGICSLHGGVDRLTMSVLMTLDESFNVVEQEIF